MQSSINNHDASSVFDHSTISANSNPPEQESTSWSELTQEKVRSFSTEGQTVLIICAFMGKDVQLSALEVATFSELYRKEEFSDDDFHTTFMEIIQLAIDERLLGVSEDDCWCRFTNRMLKKYIYNMVPSAEERPKLHYRIGLALERHMIATMDAKDLMCVVATQLNRGSLYVKREEHRLQLAEYNLKAGRQAVAMHNLSGAAKFFTSGIDVLRPYQAWDQYYDLILDLYLSSAEMNYCIGQLESCRSIIDVIMWRGKNLDDKSRAYRIQFDALIAVGNFENAKTVGTALMKHVGYDFPQKTTSGHVASELRKVKRKLNGVSDQDILALPRCEDSQEIFAMSMVERMSRLAFLTGDHEMMTLTNLMLVKASCSQLTESSCAAFATYGAIMATMGHNQQAFRFGFLSLKLLDLFPDRTTEAQSRGTIYSMILVWKDTLNDMASLFSNAYLDGIRTGHLHQGFMSGINSITIEFAKGTPLHELNYQSSKLVQEMQHCGQTYPITMVAPLYNMFLEVQGINADLGPIEQSILDIVRNESRLEILSLRLSNYCKLWFAYLGEDHKNMEKLAVLVEAKMPPKAHLLYQLMVVILGLSYFELYSHSKNRVFLREARKHFDMVINWFSLGARSCGLPAKLMETELIRLRRNASVVPVRNAYVETIDFALTKGNVAWAGLAAERGAAAMLHLDEIKTANIFVQKAIMHYRDWGAFAKVELLEIKYANLFDDGPLD